MSKTIKQFLLLSSLYLFGATAMAQSEGFDSGKTPLLPEEKVDVTGETNALMDNLREQLGVTRNQAAGALGAMFAYARNSLDEEEYERVREAIPGINELQEGDYVAGLDSDEMTEISSLPQLRDAFDSVGLNGRATEQFTTAILDYLTAQEVEQEIRGELQELWSTRPPL